MRITEEEYIAHYGILRRSGRYPWGSGDNESGLSRSAAFIQNRNELRKEGLSDSQIADAWGISVGELRALNTISRNEQKASQVALAQRLRDKGMSHGAIAERMGLAGESSVRALLAPGALDKANQLNSIHDMLKSEVDKYGLIDVSSGVESHLGISRENLNVALLMLQEDGYSTHTVPIHQIVTNHDTQTKVIGPPGMTQKEAFLKRNELKQISTFSEDGGRHFAEAHPPLSIDPKRIDIKYGPEGGADADGVIYVRPGVEDISLGKAHYAQVRVKVGDSHYMKGMAMYKEGLPDGVDLLFNSVKDRTPNKLDALKPLEPDPDFPFGSITRPLLKDANTPKERPYSVMNIVHEEGDWIGWSKSIASQVLSKQSPSLAKEQLNKTYDERKKEYQEIMSLTNPTIKRKLLEKFAEGADSAAVNLSAAALPRQNWHVILPIDTLSENQVYAPNYNNGERVVLIRYPHGGKFEIPELVVNNNHRDAKRSLGNAPDAIGINAKVAERLSGADFDGDTVLVIPNNAGKISTAKALSGLKGFDPQRAYPGYPGMKNIGNNKQTLMGDVSNLITDMTIKNASATDIAAAVRHSMVIIDAEKKNLNYKQSAIDNNIASLKAKYQGGPTAGASTLISAARSKTWLPNVKPRPHKEGGPINKKTGELEFVPTGQKKRDSDELRKTKFKKLAVTKNAHDLSSGTKMEAIYADHSNKLKALANEARLSAINTPPLKQSASAKKAYPDEIASLNSKLALVKMNRPLERQAQVVAANAVRAKVQANPNLSKSAKKKLQYRELETARRRLKTQHTKVIIEPKEWEAIQAGAISNSKLKEILDKADIEIVREFATPKAKLLMNPSKANQAQRLLARGYTRAEVADQLGVSLSTLDRSLYDT